MKRILPVPALLLCLAGPVCAIDVADLARPESVVVDPRTGEIYISNINGEPLEKDNNGYISKASADGRVVILKFIEPREGKFELHAPKGMAVSQGMLFVSDVDAVKVFRLEDGAFARSIDLAPYQPKFLNDLAADGKGNIYASDMFANRIFKITGDGAVSIYKEGEELGQPNGLFVNPRTGGLLVASWGSGQLMEVDHAGHVMILKRDLEGLDGITVNVHGELFMSSHKKGEIYRIEKWGRGALVLFESNLETPADIGFNLSQNELLVPLMSQNRVTSIKIDARSSQS